MLRLGKLADYGLLITTHLAKCELQATTEEVSIALKIPMATVRKLMKLLVDADIVISQRGAKGGYRLAMSPENINVTQVIQAVGGPINITECCDNSYSCNKKDSCDLISNWQFINDVVIKQLNQISLSDMLGDLQSQRPAGLASCP